MFVTTTKANSSTETLYGVHNDLISVHETVLSGLNVAIDLGQ